MYFCIFVYLAKAISVNKKLKPAGESGSGSLPDANLPENDGGAEEALSFGKKKKKKGASKTVDLDTAFAALDMDAQPGSPSADATGEPSDEAETVSGLSHLRMISA